VVVLYVYNLIIIITELTISNINIIMNYDFAKYFEG
jgi:hypothetical protein